MSKIKGQYIVRGNLNNIVNGYTFTGADRNAVLAASADFMFPLTCDDISRPLNTGVTLNSQNKLYVKKVRLATHGAPGLQPSINSSVASKIYLVGKAANDLAAENVGGFLVSLDQFNAWQDVNVEFLPDQTKAVNKDYYLSINHTYSKIWFDDYNIQADYIGQTFKLYFEMMIDTAGVFDYNGESV